MSTQPQTYSPLDSLAYLHRTVFEDINAAINDLEGLAIEHPAIAENVKELALFLDEAACKIDHEIDCHRLQHVNEYSNGVPIVVDYLGPAERLEDGTERRGKKQLINHPSADCTPYLTLQDDIIIVPPKETRRIDAQPENKEK
ncbi:hypothetical protein [Corynebacterium flavescens]|uniref:hypothetical protein n=1 Tax=Corynebacterium flavescens TaxID=28028 RepID=UPI003FD24C37